MEKSRFHNASGGVICSKDRVEHVFVFKFTASDEKDQRGTKSISPLNPRQCPALICSYSLEGKTCGSLRDGPPRSYACLD